MGGSWARLRSGRGKNLLRVSHSRAARPSQLYRNHYGRDHRRPWGARARRGRSGARELKRPFFRKKPTLIPEPDQQVRLRAGRGPWRGRFRAVSEPFTDERLGEVVIRVCEEKDYQNAIRQGSRPAGMPWPARQIEIVPLSPSESEDTQDLSEPGRVPTAGGFKEVVPERRPWWRRLFGAYTS